ncbi:hypothetical protein ACWDUL_33745 [Nocardia niigatensis]
MQLFSDHNDNWTFLELVSFNANCVRSEVSVMVAAEDPRTRAACEAALGWPRAGTGRVPS